MPGGQAGRVFASYSIYKGKAALAFDPRPPQFVPLEVGRVWRAIGRRMLPCSVISFCIDGCLVRNSQSGAYKVAKEGFVLLQFAPAVGPRQYDWTRKQVMLDFCSTLSNFELNCVFISASSYRI